MLWYLDGDLQEKKVVDKNIASWQQPMNHKDSSDEEDDDSIGGDEEDMNNMLVLFLSAVR